MANYVETYTSFKKDELENVSGIYKITNLINNKIYIGSAVCFFTRFRIHIGDFVTNTHYNKHLQRAWNKYGSELFKFEVIKLCNEVELEQCETWFIWELESYNPKIGYNRDKFANTRLGAVLSQKTKNKISKSLTGRKITEEQLQKQTKIIRETLGKSIVQLDLQGNFIKEWECINDASKELGIVCTNIVAHLKGKTKVCREFVFIYKELYNKSSNYSTIKGFIRKKVGKFDLQMNLQEVYENTTIAGEVNNINTPNINLVANYYRNLDLGIKVETNKTYKGFIWKYI